jgi:hypothetical protein
MKPQVACLMACSVDGRTLHNRWRPKGAGAALFEQVHDELAGDAWLVGRENGSQSGSMRPPHRVARLHYGHSLARRPSSRAAIRPVAPAPMTTMWSGLGLAIWLSNRFGCCARVLDPVTQQHRATLQRPAALQRHRRDRRTLVGLRFRRVEDARCPFRAVHRRTKDEIELVDEPGAQEATVGAAPSFEQEAFHTEFAAEYVHRKGKIEFRLTGKEVRNAFAAQAGQVRVRNGFRKYDHDRIAADIGTAPGDLALGV